jgi:hypothetical protein
MHPEELQQCRHTQLACVLHELRSSGIARLGDQARALHVGSRFLGDMMDGAPIPDVFAREVELVMRKREGWMDSSDG